MTRPTARCGWRVRSAANRGTNPTRVKRRIAARIRVPRPSLSSSTILVPVNVLSPR